ncbi:MAG: iron-sulfur cluster assembly scaffold protein [Desulfatiglandales bacterium]
MVERLINILEDFKGPVHQEIDKYRINPPRMGTIETPDGHARVTGTCGDTMEMFLRFEDETVTNASFQTDGCGSSRACGSIAAEMSIGKTPDEMLDISGEAILERLGPFPEEERHCAFLAAETLQEALHEYMLKQTSRKRPELHSPKG